MKRKKLPEYMILEVRIHDVFGPTRWLASAKRPGVTSAEHYVAFGFTAKGAVRGLERDYWRRQRSANPKDKDATKIRLAKEYGGMGPNGYTE